MPLRHLTLNEPTYVPKYNTLDTNLVAGTAGAIQQQGAQNRERGSQIQQNLQEQVLSTLGGIGDEFQAEATGLIDESISNIDKIFEQRGARGVMPSIQRESQRVQRELQPYQQVAGQAQAYQQKIDQADKVSPSVRRWARNQARVTKDEDGKLHFQSIPTEAFDNWANLNDVTQDFFKQANADVQSTGLQPSATFPQQYMERITREVLGENRLKVAGVANLLSNDQYRSQLEYEILASGDDPSETVDVVVQQEIKDDSTGEILQEEQTRKMSRVHEKALNIVDPSANIKSYIKETAGDTRQNLDARRLLDDSMPALSSTIRMGVPERNYGSPNKITEAISEHNTTIEELSFALENSENPYQKAEIQDRLNQVKAEKSGLLRHQERALNEAGINFEDADSRIKEKHQGAIAAARARLDNLKQQTDVPATYLAEAQKQIQILEDVETGFENTQLNDSELKTLERVFGKDKINRYKEILKESANAFSTNVELTSFTSKELSNLFTEHGSTLFSAGDQGDSAMDLRRIHSDPNKSQSIYETDFHEEVASLEAGGYYVDPETNQLQIAYKAFDSEGKPVGLVGGSAPTGIFDYLRPEDKHQLKSYQSSMVDVAMRAPGKEVTIQHPVLLPGNKKTVTDVTIRSKLAQNEDGSVSTKDTYGAQFVVIFTDENGKKFEVPAKSKAEAIEYLEHISVWDIAGINDRFGIGENK